MAFFKATLVLLLSIVIGFGFWYLVGWFVSNQPNATLWPWYGKLVYLFFGWQSMGGSIDYLSSKI